MNQKFDIKKITHDEDKALSTLNGNLMIPFTLMIKRKDEPHIRELKKEEILFDEDCTGNVVMGVPCNNNVFGKNCKNNIIYDTCNTIEIESGKLTMMERFKIAFQVYCKLKKV